VFVISLAPAQGFIWGLTYRCPIVEIVPIIRAFGGVRRQLALFLRTMSMNLELRSLELGQGSTPLGASGGDEGIKLTPNGDEADRPISIVLS
jgi:hypothetical protein